MHQFCSAPFAVRVFILASLKLKASKPARWSVVNKTDFVILIPYLSPFGLLSQNTIDWAASKQQKFISHISEDWDIQDQGAGRFDVLWRPAFWFHRFLSSCYVLTWCKGQGSYLVPCTRALISFMRAPPYDLITSQIPPSLKSIILGVKILTYEFWRDKDFQLIACQKIDRCDLKT